MSALQDYEATAFIFHARLHTRMSVFLASKLCCPGLSRIRGKLLDVGNTYHLSSSHLPQANRFFGAMSKQTKLVQNDKGQNPGTVSISREVDPPSDPEASSSSILGMLMLLRFSLS